MKDHTSSGETQFKPPMTQSITSATSMGEDGGMQWNNSVFCNELINYAARIIHYLVQYLYVTFVLKLLFLTSIPLFSLLAERVGSCCLHHYIQVDVWDYDTLNRDDFMGRIQIPLSILTESTTAYWFPLGKRLAKDNACGELFLEVTLRASQVISG